ncbi:MAG: UDP-3-O-(3-hydroxymyristoyl)glucosamine N-acyltransferase [Phycisphaerae bacterium]|nr:UDP-3-O-(3-hydroxymyristoyl)glucosamine N-acyltransferase [Phycisphaerae bacterium]
MKLTVAQLAERIGAELVGDGSRQIIAVGTVESAGESDVTFITNDKHIPQLKKSHAGAVIAGKNIEGLVMSQLIVKNVDAALIETLKIFAPKLKVAAEGIDPTAKVGQNVKIGKGVSVGAGAVIDDGAAIGDNSVIASGCKIGENSKIGKNCRLDSNVIIYHNCTIGNNVIIQANSTIGSTGFGYLFVDGSHKLVPHNGGVVIEDFVEIGAACCVDRAKFGNTIIGAGTKMDNLVQIAHNVVIGKCCLVAAQVGISGSCRIGDGVVLAGQVGLVDNIEIGNGTMIGAQAGVMSGTEAGARLLGSPAMDLRAALKVFGLMKRLPEMAESLKQLCKKVERLETSEDDKK